MSDDRFEDSANRVRIALGLKPDLSSIHDDKALPDAAMKKQFMADKQNSVLIALGLKPDLSPVQSASPITGVHEVKEHGGAPITPAVQTSSGQSPKR